MTIPSSIIPLQTIVTLNSIKGGKGIPLERPEDMGGIAILSVGIVPFILAGLAFPFMGTGPGFLPWIVSAIATLFLIFMIVMWTSLIKAHRKYNKALKERESLCD